MTNYENPEVEVISTPTDVIATSEGIESPYENPEEGMWEW